MRFLIVFSCALCLFMSCQEGIRSDSNEILISNITVVDPTEGVMQNRNVLIRNEKIVEVADTNLSSRNSNAEFIDGTGKFLIPGLWDAHVHFAFFEELAPRMLDLFIAYGVTSVRDTGGKIEFVKKWKDRALEIPGRAPRVMIAGPLLDGMPNVYDGSTPRTPLLSVGLNDEDEARSYIDFLDSVGVDLLKAYEMLTPEQFTTINKIAQEKGYRVTGHVPLSMDVIEASNAGLSSMEHMRNLELSCASNASDLLMERRQILMQLDTNSGSALRALLHRIHRPVAIQNFSEEKASEVLSVLRENQTWQVPTIALNTGGYKQHYRSAEWQKSFKYLPDSTENRWITQINDLKPEISDWTRKYTKWKMEMVNRIHEAEIEIMAGTDCPLSYLTPGPSLHYEMEVLVECGLSPLEALKTATYNPAVYFGLENELGKVAKGYWADLVLLNFNPMDDIRNTNEIYGVIKQGNYLDRAELDLILTNLDEN